MWLIPSSSAICSARSRRSTPARPGDSRSGGRSWHRRTHDAVRASTCGRSTSITAATSVLIDSTVHPAADFDAAPPVTESASGDRPAPGTPDPLTAAKELFSTLDPNAHQGACGGGLHEPALPRHREAPRRTRRLRDQSEHGKPGRRPGLSLSEHSHRSRTSTVRVYPRPSTGTATTRRSKSGSNSTRRTASSCWSSNRPMGRGSQPTRTAPHAGDTNPYANRLTGPNPGLCA